MSDCKANLWMTKMADRSCYKPAPPFYDYCQNIKPEGKSKKCDECVEERGIVDYIE